VDLYVAPTRATGTLDPLDREKQVGPGCALETVVCRRCRRTTTLPVMEPLAAGNSPREHASVLPCGPIIALAIECPVVPM